MNKQDRKLVTTSEPTEHRSMRPSRRPYARIFQNFFIVWLDENIDEGNDDYQNIIVRLREISNTVNTCTNVDECTSFISDIKARKAFMIFSGALAQSTVPIVHDMAQINTIYIFSENKAQHEQWAQQWPKVKGVFTDVKSICEALKKGVQECDQNNIPMSFVAVDDDGSNKNLEQLNQSFMYTQILKEILFSIDFQTEHFIAFILFLVEKSPVKKIVVLLACLLACVLACVSAGSKEHRFKMTTKQPLGKLDRR